MLLNTPPGWWVGKPSYQHHERVWKLYAYDTRERHVHGRRERAFTVTGRTEAACVDGMARTLWEFAARRLGG